MFSVVILPVAAVAADAPPIVIGAKRFTENAILAELMAGVLEAQTEARVERRLNLAGTDVCFDGLRSGALDLYAEYTGTGLRNVLRVPGEVGDPASVFALVSREFRERYDLEWLAPFGFNNTYVLIVRRALAERLGLEKISDLSEHSLRYGMSHEFLRRPDGLPGLRRAYTLDAASTVGMEHDLAYEALAQGAIDVSDGYSTDAKIVRHDLVPLADDRHFFPPYEAAPLVRRDLLQRVPGAAGALALLAGRLDDEAMRRLNDEVEGERRSARAVAQEFLRELGVGVAESVERAPAEGLLELLWQRRARTLELAGRHLMLILVALLMSCAVGIPLGIVSSRRADLTALALAGAGILQTIPSIALLVFMLPLFGVGVRPAIAALFLYGLLPIVRNTVTGIRGIDPHLTEVARGLGMRSRQVLFRVELPLASRVILAGVRTSTVINVGTATLAAFIGAGGLGDPIVTGLATTDTNLVLCGALPAAALALALDALLGGIERLATPRGLRISAAAAARERFRE